MKIGFVVPSLTSGGAERAASIFATLMSRVDNNDVVIFAFFDSEHKYSISSNVKFIAIYENRKLYKNANKFAKLSKIKNTINNEKVDILIPFVTYVGYILSFLFIRRNFALIETIRTSPFACSNIFKRCLRNNSIYSADGVIFQTRYQSSYFNLKKIKRYTYINNPIYLNREKNIKTFKKISKFIYVGRLCNEKNPMLLLTAFSIFLKNNSNCTLDVFGDGPLMDICLKYVFDSKIEKNVTFYGYKDINYDLLCKYDCFLLPSNIEGMPNSLLEAMSCGLICISAIYNDGIKDIIIDGVNGFLFESGNIESLLFIMNKVVKLSLKIINDISLNAMKKIKSDFSTDIVSKKLLNFLYEYEKK